MSTIDRIEFPAVLAAGLTAGAAGAVVNAAYFFAYRAVTEREFTQTGVGSVVVSSFLPPVLGVTGALLLSRVTRHAGALFVMVTIGITAASLLPGLSASLPDGTLKPAGFDALVLPMHVVVGALAAWFIPRSLKAGT